MSRIGLGLVAALVVGCNSPVIQTTWPLLVSLETPDGVVGVFRDGNGTHLVLDNQDTGGQPDTSAPSVHLFSTGGDSGRTYNSFVYGWAPPGATQVELSGLDAIGGTVKGQSYILATKRKNILPQQLVWTFRDARGLVVEAGSNITP